MPSDYGLNIVIHAEDRASPVLEALRIRIEHCRFISQAQWAAERAEAHADWYCSLPWWRQWWAMVTHR